MIDSIHQADLGVGLFQGCAAGFYSSGSSFGLFDRIALFSADFANCVGHFCIHITYTKMENGRTMFLHSVVIGIVAYLFMIYVLGQSQVMAENRSFLLGAVVLAYMILFGHGLPTSLNKGLF
jgi:hypothetical protein